MAAEQCAEDEHLVTELVPRVIAHLANRHGAPAGESTDLLDNELLLQVLLPPTRTALSPALFHPGAQHGPCVSFMPMCRSRHGCISG